jgi:ABC-type transport system substrate-binding protein
VQTRTAVFGLDTNPPGFDPQRWWNSATYSGTANVFEQLIGIDPSSGSLQPQLITALPDVSEDGTRYTFPLRRNVRFHHGRELTSADVKFSLERLSAPSTQAEAGSLFASLPIRGMRELLDERTSGLTGITTPDRYPVSIQLDEPDRALLPQLTYLSTAILPADMGGASSSDFNWAPIGTGPYLMEGGRSDEQATLRRNPAYWGRPPEIEAIRFEFNRTQPESVERIRSSVQDFMFEPLSASLAVDLQSDEDLSDQFFLSDEDCCYFLTLPIGHPALSNRLVRRAIAMAIDKQKLAEAVRQLAIVSTGGLFSPLSPYFSDGLAHAYDPRSARDLLAQAGYAHGLELNLLVNNLFPEKEISSVIAGELACIGMRLTIVERRYNEKSAIRGQHSLSLCDWHLSLPHGSYLMDAAFTRAALDCGCCNYSGWTSHEFEGLARLGHTAIDRAGEIAAYRRMDAAVVRDEVLWVPLLYGRRADLVSKRVRGFTQARYPSALVKYFFRYGLGAPLDDRASG